MFKPKGNRHLIIPLMALLMTLSSASAYAVPPLWLQLRHTTSVGEGTKHPQHLFYVITDPNCPYCHELWSELQPYYSQGLRVRYVMVGIIADNSPGKAAAILEARHPAAALDKDERGWQSLPDDMGGGIPPLANPKPKTLALLKDDEKLMHDLGVQGTPALIYLDSHGVMQILQSVPNPATLAAIVKEAAPK